MRYLWMLVFALAATPVCAEEVLSLAELRQGETLVVESERGTLTFTVIDGARGECWLDGQRVRILGATQGRQDGYLLIDMGVAKPGYRLEVELRGRRFLTAPVKRLDRRGVTA